MATKMKITKTVIAAIIAVICVLIASIVGAWYYARPQVTETHYFGLAMVDHSNAWESLLADGFFWWCEDHGVKAVMMDARHTIDLQAVQIHSLVDMGIDGLIAFPADPKALNSEFDYCKQHNVAVVCTPFIADHPSTLMWVAVSFVEQGQLSANQTLNFLEKKYGSPKGVVLELRGKTGETAAEQRHNGFIDVMKNYPDIEVLTKDTEWMTEKAADITSKEILARPDIDAVYCANLAIVDGFLAGMKTIDKDPTPYFVVGLDAGPSVLQGVRDNTVDVCVEQVSPAWYAAICCEYLLSYLEKGSAALPKVGDVVTVEDLNTTGLLTDQPRYGVDIWAYPTWSPATIMDTHAEGLADNNILHFKMSNVIITKDNVDNPAWWGNMKLPGW